MDLGRDRARIMVRDAVSATLPSQVPNENQAPAGARGGKGRSKADARSNRLMASRRSRPAGWSARSARGRRSSWTSGAVDLGPVEPVEQFDLRSG
jgi:hypothetical protein